MLIQRDVEGRWEALEIFVRTDYVYCTSLCCNFLKFHYALKFPREKVLDNDNFTNNKSILNIYKYLFSMYIHKNIHVIVMSDRHHSYITNEQIEAQSMKYSD